MAAAEACHIDIETYSEAPLKKCGAYRYAEHPSTEILSIAYKFDDGPVNLWVPRSNLPKIVLQPVFEQMEPDGRLYASLNIPKDLYEHFANGGKGRAHNAQFERVLLNAMAGQEIGFPHTEISQWVCTAAKTAAHGLPRSLEEGAAAAGTRAKDAAGKMDMMFLCKPRKASRKTLEAAREHDVEGAVWEPRATPETDPERHIGLYLYNMDDVRAEYDLDQYVPDLSPYEQRVWELDQLINDRGMRVDPVAIANAQVLLTQYKKILEKKCIAVCGLKPTQREALAAWIRTVGGYPVLVDLQAQTVIKLLELPDLPPAVRTLLKIYTYYGMKAVAKFSALEGAVCADGRVRGMYIYFGAATGRWSSVIAQLHNLFRPVIKDPELAIDMFAARDLAYLQMLYDENPMKVLASTVRGMLIPDPGSDLLCEDFSAIEGCITAWLAGDQIKLEVYRTDGRVYEFTAAGILRKSVDKIGPDERFLYGKIPELALGFQGGKKAFVKMAKQHGATVDEERGDQIKEQWRLANPKTVSLWYELERVAASAVANPGKIFALKNKKLMFKTERDWLYMRLPSGRRVAYFKPQLDLEGKVTFLGIDTFTRRWGRVKTYGGRWTENAAQAIARDLLANGLLKLETAGYPVVGSTHDEGITEPAEDFGSLDEAAAVMCQIPEWAGDLPVRAKGFRVKRYRK